MPALSEKHLTFLQVGSIRDFYRVTLTSIKSSRGSRSMALIALGPVVALIFQAHFLQDCPSVAIH